MASRWYKPIAVDNKKRHTLHSLGVGFVFFVALFAFTKIFAVPLCPIKNFLGVSCFGCGMTRGFISIIHLDFKAAFAHNVLSIPIFIGVVIYTVCAGVDVIFDKNYVAAIEKQLAKKYMYIVYVIVLIAATVLNNTGVNSP